MKMTKAQFKVADAIWTLRQELGYPPTVAEIGERVGRTPSAVQLQIENLVRIGKLDRQPGKIRTLTLSREGEEEVLGS